MGRHQLHSSKERVIWIEFWTSFYVVSDYVGVYHIKYLINKFGVQSLHLFSSEFCLRKNHFNWVYSKYGNGWMWDFKWVKKEVVQMIRFYWLVIQNTWTHMIIKADFILLSLHEKLHWFVVDAVSVINY